jgi:hypothetical protein
VIPEGGQFLVGDSFCVSCCNSWRAIELLRIDGDVRICPPSSFAHPPACPAAPPRARALPASARTRPKTMKNVSHYGGRQYVCQKDAANKNHFDLILGVGRSSLRSLYLSSIHIL